MAQGNDRTMLVAASGSDSDVQANTTGRSHRRRMTVGGTAGMGVALAVVLWRSYGRKDSATPAFKGDSLDGRKDSATPAFKGVSLVSLALDEELCGHTASVCVRPLGSPGAFFSKDCLSGGVGCSAWGWKCCRVCGAGDFATIKCPTAADKPAAGKSAARKDAAAAAREKIDRDKKVADKIAADKVDEDKMIANNTADDKAATDKAAAAKAARDKKVADQIAADKVYEEKMIANNTAALKTATESMVTKHRAVDKAAADKMVADQIAAANKADKAAADQVAAQRAALGR